MSCEKFCSSRASPYVVYIPPFFPLMDFHCAVLKLYCGGPWTGLTGLRKGTISGLLWGWVIKFRAFQNGGIAWLVEELLASYEALCSTDLATQSRKGLMDFSVCIQITSRQVGVYVWVLFFIKNPPRFKTNTTHNILPHAPHTKAIPYLILTGLKSKPRSPEDLPRLYRWHVGDEAIWRRTSRTSVRRRRGTRQSFFLHQCFRVGHV
jgi:hypothetical protein